MEDELLRQLEEDVTEFLMTSSLNYVSKQMAVEPRDIGMRLYDAPIFGVGSAEDPLWEQLKQKQAVGELFTTPKEWCPWAKTVISYFAPFSDDVVRGNRQDKVRVGNGWLYARVEGQNFLTTMNHFIEEWFQKRRLRAFSPYASDRFRYVFEAGSAENIANKKLSFTSNWSERHVAFVSGLGTFGLSKGLITRRGVSGRYGSVITDVDLPITKRDYSGLYDYCTMCGKCIEQCPAKAISFENGKDHHKCSSYFDTVRIKYAPRFGCGKCQVSTPCERGIPAKSTKK